jgi:SSS family solute:Na+ symporter
VTISALSIATFLIFIVAVVAVSLYASRREDTSEDYFLAGRKLTWPLIGFSLIASNISTEHFVGMAGSAFGRVGLAIASYEWMAAITLVIVAWWLLPKFLRSGIYTMPEYLEYRYDGATRSIMATYLMLLYIFALLATVLYSGAQGLNGVFGFPEMLANNFDMSPEDSVYWSTVGGAWFIGIVAAAYTVYGGLKAVVWSDLLQGGALLIGGAIVLYLGLKIVGGGTVGDDGGVSGGSVVEGWKVFSEQNADKLHVVLPWNDPDVPWLAVFVGGLWIPNLFYWGLNQFITQRTLGAKSLAEGQRGIFLACFFKLLIPFIIVFPGIIAFQLYGDAVLAKTGGDVAKAGELAYPTLIAEIMPPVLRGVMLAALRGRRDELLQLGDQLSRHDLHDRRLQALSLAALGHQEAAARRPDRHGRHRGCGVPDCAIAGLLRRRLCLHPGDLGLHLPRHRSSVHRWPAHQASARHRGSDGTAPRCGSLCVLSRPQVDLRSGVRVFRCRGEEGPA